MLLVTVMPILVPFCFYTYSFLLLHIDHLWHGMKLLLISKLSVSINHYVASLLYLRQAFLLGRKNCYLELLVKAGSCFNWLRLCIQEEEMIMAFQILAYSSCLSFNNI